ncbi:CRP/FNR family transcriptional regulator, anaerobic regulatory protein [Novosphingobium sp. CF614]|uniref:Crp/Fnr family transcriptional regulator n=1 Tax=Novosphingobium sp. CF614 TaxID=1884364 RepID=UPI0008EFA352|nr:Crp/Fnr family transcriptional regulator [Novosphingobium sp. CF614]SFG17851.1 CRP/FNR family transcriptional regulator, anaerobic regulatory protein [Novosphingobium sp. CF614]
MDACAHCAVRESAICHSLSDDKLEELSRFGRRQNVRRGQTLMWEDEESLLVGNVIDGVLKLSASSRNGCDQTLGIAYPSDFIGRPFGRRSYQSVTALTDAQVCTFTRADFDAVAQRNPGLEHKLLQRTLADLDHARQWMVLLGQKSAVERVATFLLEMGSRLGQAGDDDGARGPIEFELPFGRQDIAEVLGLTIETVSRQITKLRGEGLIDTPTKRKVVIRDREALEACADGS